MKDLRHIIRRMGFVRDQEGIMNRYLREHSGWEVHLKRTRSFIETSFSQGSVGSVAILGSGWLLDVPLENLTRRFDRVFLADIHHPPQIRRKVRDLKQVELVTADLSGGAVHQLWELHRQKKLHTNASWPGDITLEPPLAHLETDAYVSVNLLNQLDIMLCDFLRRHGYFKLAAPDGFRKMIQSFHLEWITRKPGCLITDTTEFNLDREGNESARGLLYTELPSGFRSEQWDWEFDTMKTYRPGNRTRMRVRAVEWA